MRFTPFQTFRLCTDLSYEEVCDRLRKVIGKPRGINPMAGRSEPYLGVYESGRFVAKRDAYSFRAPRPTISGEVSRVGTGSILLLRMRPGRSADIFLAISALLFAAELVRQLIIAFSGGADLVAVAGNLIALLMGAFLFVGLYYVFVTVSIRLGSRMSRDFFAKLIEARQVVTLNDGPGPLGA
jgi:hypothetical protein